MKPVSFNIYSVKMPRTPEYVVIDATLGNGISCGFIATETLDDIFTLRDEINRFINEHLPDNPKAKR